MLHAEALVIHLFVAANRDRPEADQAYLSKMWSACGPGGLGMTERIPDTGVDVDVGDGWSLPGSALLAARMRPRPEGQMTPYVEEALLRRQHDAYCLSVMREPAPDPRKAWAELDREWADAVKGITPSGVLGEARLYLCRLVDPGTPAVNTELKTAVRDLYQLDQQPGNWLEGGVVVPQGFAVWETCAREDDRTLRRIVVVAAADQDIALSEWAWVVGAQELPRFGHYLLQAAKLRYQRRVWGEAEQTFRQARWNADATIRRLLATVAHEPNQDDLIQASRDLMTLHGDTLVGLVQTSTRLREMCHTAEIAMANMAALSGDDTHAAGVNLRGLFADDRRLGDWFVQQLNDDALYLGAARERAEYVASWIDLLVQRGLQQRQEELQRRRERLQHRQEHFNLALAGVISAVILALTAIQSLQYSVPLPPLIKPAVITTLGAVALLAALVTLRVAVPRKWWTLWLVWAGAGAASAAATWVVVSAFAGDAASTGFWAGGGFAGGVVIAVLVWHLRGRRGADPDSDHTPA